jgi:hypothetical protein
MQFGLRTLGMLVGLVGTCIAFAINLLYTVTHVLERVVGISTSSSHFLWGLLIVLASLVGSVLGLFSGITGAVILIVCAIALFFVAGWWALFASPFLVLAAVLLYAGRGERVHTAAAS